MEKKEHSPLLKLKQRGRTGLWAMPGSFPFEDKSPFSGCRTAQTETDLDVISNGGDCPEPGGSSECPPPEGLVDVSR